MTESSFRLLQHRVALEAALLTRILAGQTATDFINWESELMRDVRFGPQITRLLKEMDA